MKVNSRWQSPLLIVPAAILFIVAFAWLTYRPAAGREPSPGRTPVMVGDPVAAPTDQMIIKYRAGADLSGENAPAHPSRMQQLSTAAGLDLAYGREMSGETHVLRLPAALPVAEVVAAAARLESLPDVQYAEPDSRLYPLLSPNDPAYSDQWHYYEAYGINAPAAWEITTGSPNVTIAVIDTGITDHGDLDGRWVGGFDFIVNLDVANDGDPRDSDPHDPGDWIASNECYPGSEGRNSSWHGTHLAGTIGAASNNGTGVAGVNWASPIVPVRTVGKCGGYLSDIIDGMRWAAGLTVAGVPDNQHPARVLNISLGTKEPCSDTYQQAINDVNATGGIVVVGAGNINANLDTTAFQPANCHGVITVAATDRGGDKAFYSNYGRTVEISAPGGENVDGDNEEDPTYGVLSTLNLGETVPIPGGDSYAYYQGTSMAVPHVVGVISLLLSVDPALDQEQVLTILQETARPFPAGSSCTTATCGSGIIDAGAALLRLVTQEVYLPVVTGP